jgi:hypothetical protein
LHAETTPGACFTEVVVVLEALVPEHPLRNPASAKRTMAAFQGMAQDTSAPVCSAPADRPTTMGGGCPSGAGDQRIGTGNFRHDLRVTKVHGSQDHTVHDELLLILGDLTDPFRADDRATYEVRPLRDDDHFPHRPEILEGEVPRYWWVSVEGRSLVADLTSPPASRIYFMAEMAQDTLAEERREALPWCPVHRTRMMIVELEEDEVFWQCPDDRNVRCEIGGYWAWRRRLGL